MMDLLWAWTVVSSPPYLFLKKSSWQHVCWFLPLLHKTSILLLKILTTQCKAFALSKSAEILLQFQWTENIFEANKYSDIYMYLLSWHWKLCKTFCISSPSPTHSVLRMSVDYAGTISLPFPCFLLFLASDFFFIPGVDYRTTLCGPSTYKKTLVGAFGGAVPFLTLGSRDQLMKWY